MAYTLQEEGEAELPYAACLVRCDRLRGAGICLRSWRHHPSRLRAQQSSAAAAALMKWSRAAQGFAPQGSTMVNKG